MIPEDTSDVSREQSRFKLGGVVFTAHGSSFLGSSSGFSLRRFPTYKSHTISLVFGFSYKPPAQELSTPKQLDPSETNFNMQAIQTRVEST